MAEDADKAISDGVEDTLFAALGIEAPSDRQRAFLRRELTALARDLALYRTVDDASPPGKTSAWANAVAGTLQRLRRDLCVDTFPLSDEDLLALARKSHGFAQLTYRLGKLWDGGTGRDLPLADDATSRAHLLAMFRTLADIEAEAAKMQRAAAAEAALPRPTRTRTFHHEEAIARLAMLYTALTGKGPTRNPGGKGSRPSPAIRFIRAAGHELELTWSPSKISETLGKLAHDPGWPHHT